MLLGYLDKYQLAAQPAVMVRVQQASELTTYVDRGVDPAGSVTCYGVSDLLLAVDGIAHAQYTVLIQVQFIFLEGDLVLWVLYCG